MKCFSVNLIILIFLIYPKVKAQDAVSIRRLTEPLLFDGIPDESQWESLNSFNLTMHRSTFGLAPSEISDIR